MGGRALLKGGVETRRVTREEMHEISKEIISTLQTSFNFIGIVPYYKNKETFGDLDLIVSKYTQTEPITEKLANLFAPKFIYHNGNVYSFDYKDFQIDLILTAEEHIDMLVTYMSYNDLGNLMGRVARSMGFRYGEAGLTYSFPSKYNFNEKRIIVSTDAEKIFRFLGFDYKRFLQGFDELEDVFKFVINSYRFSEDIFRYENLDHTNRLRNRKRENYRKFLEYIDTNNIKAKFPYESKEFYLKTAIQFFGEEFNNKLLEAKAWDDKCYENSLKFNGNLIMELTGLNGKELGEFITKFKNSYIDFDKFIQESSTQKIIYDIVNFNKSAE